MATTKLTFKDVEYDVNELPQHIQQVIACYDEAEARYRKAELDLIIASSSKKFLTGDISKFIEEWLAAPTTEQAELEVVEEATEVETE